MKKYQLSILIPSRNEQFISHTVADIIKNKRGNTEVIVGLDGEWASPGIMSHPDVRIVHVSESLGQRGMTNYICKLSNAKYVAKVDAHCTFDEGFDVKLMEEMEDDMTMVPIMRNLHAFNWKCKDCGDETYQGPPPEGCKSCDVNTADRFEQKLVWRAKPSPNSTAYRFNKNLQFKYFPELKQVQEGDVSETMSLQGSFFMLTREKYWELNICDENWGGWGQQGTEVALKTWLSGGRVVCNRRTWYAHLFRTQPGFSFPWPNSGKQQDRARRMSQDLFLNNKWEKQIHPLSWVLEKFWDDLKRVNDSEAKWEEKDLEELRKIPLNNTQSKGIIFYTDNQLNLKIANKVQKNLLNISKKKNLPITSASLKRMDFGHNIRLRMERGWLAYFNQIVAALENSTADIVFFCEHDVLYTPEHFDFTPERKDKFYYNQNFWRIRPDGFAVHWDANQVSGLCAYREHALAWYKNRLKEVEENGFNRSYEPGGRDKEQYEVWNSERPNIDIRHQGTLTKDKWSPEDFRDKSTCVNWQEADYTTIPGWDKSQLEDILDL